jgi:hypothetical protein
VSGDYLQGENLRSLIGRQRHLCVVPFLKASLLKSLEFRTGVVLMVVVLLLLGLEPGFFLG